MNFNINNTAQWLAIVTTLGGGFLRFGAVENEVEAAATKAEKVDARIENMNTRVEARFEVVRAEKLVAEERLVSQVHSLDKNVAVLTEEVRQLRIQLERTSVR